MDFIANEGTGAHRGVWHITDNLTSKEIPAYTEDRDFGYGIYHYIHEFTIEYHGDAICGQIDNMEQGGYHGAIYKRNSPVEGETKSIYRAKRADIVIGLDGYIPGPLCSRCAKKAGIEF